VTKEFVGEPEDGGPLVVGAVALSLLVASVAARLAIRK